MRSSTRSARAPADTATEAPGLSAFLGSAGPAIGDRRPPVLAEGLVRDPHARGRLAPLVLVAIDQLCDAPSEIAVEAARDELGDRLVILDVSLDDGIEHLVGGERVGVLLIRAQFRRRRLVDDRLGDDFAPGTRVEVTAQRVDRR